MHLPAQLNMLITGAGGAAAISVHKALKHLPYRFFMADMDVHAAGLYLVEASQRLILPRGDNPDFVTALLKLVQEHQISVLIPTVEAEMIALAPHQDLFKYLGIKLMMPQSMPLEICLDKWKLMQAATGVVPVTQSKIYDEQTNLFALQFPMIAKPRRGAGSTGIFKINALSDLATIPQDGTYMLQKYLPGKEYSVDVLADENGKVYAAVPRERLKVDSGIAVAAKTVSHELLEGLAADLVEHLKLGYVVNVQFKCNANGIPCLLEINPRFPGTMPLTVASGVNMPLLALKMMFGYLPTPQECQFTETAVVRYLEEIYYPPTIFDSASENKSLRLSHQQAHCFEPIRLAA
jgi:carbamoyl-phosphate synthase large subunit